MAPLPTLLRREFAAPRYWGSWIVLALWRVLALLPYMFRMRVGQLLGMAAYWVPTRRKHIAKTNLHLCFPEKSGGERAHLLRAHFASLGIAFVEMAGVWWAPERTASKIAKVEGLHHLRSALEKGRGVILLGAHFTSMEVVVRRLARHEYIYGIYRPLKNKLLECALTRARSRQVHQGVLFPREDVRTLLRALRTNKVVWYPPDQDHGRRQSVFVDFFGQQAAMLTTTSRIARMTGAAVVPLLPYRLPNGQGYGAEILPALDQFPSGDDQQDAQRIMSLVESWISRYTAQYVWVHRRFKTRPNENDDVYT